MNQKRFDVLYYITVHAFTNGISPKVNVIGQLKIKLTFSNFPVQHIRVYGIGLHPGMGEGGDIKS